METTAIDGMCRCCASSGIFKDMYATYNWMGEDEIYANMLQYCFDITLSTAEDQNNGGICEVCITQLRNAANFKKQVQNTETQFKRFQEEKEFNSKAVKIEISEMTDLIDDVINTDNEMSDSEGEFTLNIKQENPEPKAKKRAKATSSRATDDDIGETSTKRVAVLAKVKRRFAQNENTLKSMVLKFTTRITPATVSGNLLTEAVKNQHNLAVILLNSNANPIRCKDSQGYGCAFCSKQFLQPTALKKHFLDEHNNDRFIKFMSSRVSANVVKLDITYLSCALCDTEFSQLNDFVKHLKTTHKKEVYEDVKSEILPFKFDAPELKCAICSTEYSTFKILQTHMNKHFANYICNICAAGFVTERLLQNHINRHGNGEHKCSQCDKSFPTLHKKQGHVQRVHLGLNKRNKCNYCDERFVDYWQKVKHMVKIHGEPPVVLKCQACERTFNNQRALSRHYKKYHLLERRHPCLECDMTFFHRSDLVKHMTKHTGLRQYSCDICKKSYSRKNTLREHMRIHIEDRRHKCEYCGQGFVQKCNWRGHMKSKHGENV